MGIAFSPSVQMRGSYGQGPGLETRGAAKPEKRFPLQNKQIFSIH
jgi:hypothetical protein